ncbi:interleukin-18 receptor 1-like isoform X2 [Lineus longissimus]
MEDLAALLFILFLAPVTAELSVTRAATWPPDVVKDNGLNKLPLRCQIHSDPGEFNVTWYRNSRSTPINISDHFTVETDMASSTLVISDPRVNDTATYGCLVQNQIGERANASNYLIVYDHSSADAPARITEVMLPQDGVSLGDDVNLTCVIFYGRDDWTLQSYWYHDGQSVNDTSKHAWQSRYVAGDTHFGLIIVNITDEDLGNYTCNATNQYGSDIRTLDLKLKKKQPAPRSVLLTILASAGGTVVFVAIIVTARVARMRKKEPGLDDLPWFNTENYEASNHPLEYDVFISYSSQDIAWVKDILMKNLEKQGCRVCIDFKCFMPGMPVVENIMEAIYKSKRTIVIMSKNFLKSVWGAFELEQVQHRLITMRDDSLLLVKYDGCQIPRKLMGKTFLDWSDKSVKPHFWDRLFKTLGPDRVQYKEDSSSMLGMDINRPTDFEQAFLETEQLRTLSDEEPLLERFNGHIQGPEEEDSLLHNSGSSGFGSYGSDNQTLDGVLGGVVV